MQQTSLIATVGSNAQIGPMGGLPLFADMESQLHQSEWFKATTRGGIVVLGSTTARIMRSGGATINAGPLCAIWSRKDGMTPEDFHARLLASGRSVFICGGETTFRLFAPFCDNFLIHRTHLISNPDHHLAPILAAWQSRVPARQKDLPFVN